MSNKTEPKIYFDTIYELEQISDEFEVNKQKWHQIEKFFDVQSTPTQTPTHELTTTQINPIITQQFDQISEVFENHRKFINGLTQDIQNIKIMLSIKNDEFIKLAT